MRKWPTPDWRFVGWHYHAMHAFAHPWHNPLLVRGKGLENLPRAGGFVYAANHTSWWDPIVMAAVLGRPVCFLGKKEVFRGPFTRWFFGRGGVIPVERHWEKKTARPGDDAQGRVGIPVDRNARNPEAMTAALQALRDGRVVGIFPEGTRHAGRLGPARPGVARLALQAGVPVVPAGILSDRFWGPGRKVPRLTEKVRINVGKPLTLQGDPDDPEAWRRGTERVMSAVDALLNEAWLARERGEKWKVP